MPKGPHGAIIFFLFLLSIPRVDAVITLSETNFQEYAPTNFMGGARSHVGEICIACHTRFSNERAYADRLPFNVSNRHVLHIFPCDKGPCHKTPPTKFAPRGKARWSMHMVICENCHPRWESSVETVHNTHRNFTYLLINRSNVECKLCHSVRNGYNSSIVRVPPWPPEAFETGETIVKPEWEGDCSFCHFTIKGAERVHDVHQPVIEKVCTTCHSSYVLQNPGLFSRINVPYPFEKEKEAPTLQERLISTVSGNQSILDIKDKKPSDEIGDLRILSEFYLYFNGILESLLNIYRLIG